MLDFTVEPVAPFLYIWSVMNWLMGGSLLAGCAAALRWILGLDNKIEPCGTGLLPLSPDREAIFSQLSQDIETQCTILGITLNDAFDERLAGRTEIAVRLVQLCGGEWERVDGILHSLLKTIGGRMGEAQVAIPLRGVSAHRFKSKTMIDFYRMYEFLDQLVFRSRLRFQLQVRVLRRASETLAAEFYRNCRYLERTNDPDPEFWKRLDLLFHDMDLLGKETLLAFRSFLLCLPDSSIASFAAEVWAAHTSHERALIV